MRSTKRCVAITESFIRNTNQKLKIMELVGTWTLYFAWKNPPQPMKYYYETITFNAGGSMNINATWTQGPNNQVTFQYDNSDNKPGKHTQTQRKKKTSQQKQ